MNEATPEIKIQKRIFGLPKNIFFLGITSFFNDFSSEMVFSIFPAFFTSVLKTGAASIGFVDGIAEVSSSFFKIYSGNLSDKLQSRKPLVVIGYVLSVLTRPFYIFTSTVFGALGLRVIDRVGKGLRDAPRDALISFSSPKEELGRSFGYHRAMDISGAIFGPFAAYLILKYFPLNFNAVFLTAFFAGLITIFTLFFISEVVLTPSNNSTNKISIFSVFKNLSFQFKLFIISIFILSIGSLPVVIVLLKVESIGLIIASIPLFYMVYNFSYVIFSTFAGKISDKFGARIVIFTGYIFLLISYVLINMAQSQWVLVIGFLLFGLFPALTDGTQRTLTSQISNPEVRGSALGLLNAAIGLGVLIAGIGGGYLWQVCGSSITIFVSSLIIVAGLIIFLISSKREKISFN